jgi:hypothetical protein
MADYRIQLKDKEGNRQFPVTTTQSIVDSEGRSLEEILANLGDGGGSGNGGGFEVRIVYPTKQTVLEEETIDITEEERAYNIETLSKTLNGETVFCKVGEAILFPTISMSGVVTEATYSTVVVLGGSLASYSLTITSNGDAEVVIADVTTGGGGGDMSALVTKEELSEAEEVAAAALNDLEERKASKEYVEDALGNVSVDTSTLVTKEEFTDVEEVWAASYNLLNQKISDVQQYIYDEAASRRQFDEAIAEIQSIIAENESVVTAAWNQLNTRINALEAAQAQGE